MCLIGSNSEMLLGCCQGRASAGASVVTFCLLWLEHVGTWNSNHHGQEAKHFQSASKILIILQAQGQTGLQDPKNVYYYILLSILLSIYLYILYIWCMMSFADVCGVGNSGLRGAGRARCRAVRRILSCKTLSCT